MARSLPWARPLGLDSCTRPGIVRHGVAEEQSAVTSVQSLCRVCAETRVHSQWRCGAPEDAFALLHTQITAAGITTQI